MILTISDYLCAFKDVSVRSRAESDALLAEAVAGRGGSIAWKPYKYSTVQYSKAKYSTVKYSQVQSSIVQQSTVQ